MILKLKELNQYDLLVKMESENYNFQTYEPAVALERPEERAVVDLKNTFENVDWNGKRKRATRNQDLRNGSAAVYKTHVERKNKLN